jgi:hypothetical protein
MTVTKEFEAHETGDIFLKSFKAIAAHKPRGRK